MAPGVEREHDSPVVPPAPPFEAYSFGPFKVDAAALQLRRGEEQIPLPPKAFDTLLILLRNRNRVVTKDELMRLVWRDAFVTEDSLSQTISTLRRVLGDDSNQPHFIATVPRRGYRFIAAAVELTPPTPVQMAPPVTTTVELPEPAVVRGDAVPPPWPVKNMALVSALAAAAAAIVTAVILSSRPAAEIPRLRLTVAAPSGTRVSSGGVLSPDGRSLAFVAEDVTTSATQLWVRRLDESDARAVAGTAGASKPFWSPDGSALGFFAGGSLRTVGLTGDPPQTVAAVGLTPSGGAWGPDNVLLFTGLRTGVNAVPASAGGQARPVTMLDRSAQEVAHESPQILPNTRDFLYVVDSPNAGRAGTYVGSLDGSVKVRLLPDPAVYAPPGYLLYVRDDTLFAQEYDAGARRMMGVPARIAGNVTRPTVRGGGIVSASHSGLLAFGGEIASSRMAWFDRSGQPLPPVTPSIDLHDFAASRDASQLYGSAIGVWSVDIEREVPTRLVLDGRTPEPSPDGRQLAYVSARQTGIADIYLRQLTGPDQDTLLLRTAENKNVNDWSPDGERIVYISVSPMTNADIWTVSRRGDQPPIVYLNTAANEIQARVSPDGRWLAYASDESGTWEVYVQAFPVAGSKRGISVGGGAQPQWRRDGRELVYLSADHRLMSVDVQPGDAFRASKPRPLFRVAIAGGLNAYRRHYLPSADAKQFLVDSVNADTDRVPITLLSNWTSFLQRK
jgi:eukaryotic-like serine/threonine-protein kinase